MYQKYISKIRPENLQKFLIELNKIAINEGIEDIECIRQDSTIVETNIHHPTNNSILWDCTRVSIIKFLQIFILTVQHDDFSY